MRYIFKVTAIVGTLGLFGALAINLFKGGETVSEIAAPETNPQQSIQTLDFSSDTPEQAFGYETDIPVDESDLEFVEMSESEALEFEQYLQSLTEEELQNSEEFFIPEDDQFNAEPFLGHEAGLKYDEFFAQMDTDESLTEEQIQEFFNRMSATIETSDEAKDAIARAYRNTEDDNAMERGIIAEMLMKTDTGREILLNEANSILENGQEDRFADMFQTHQNIDEQINTQVLDQALLSASTSTDLAVATSALNYIGRLEDDTAFSPVYTNQAVSTLENISLYNENEDVRSLATQKLYRILGPEKSTAVAQYNIDNNVSSPLVIETLYSIGSGDVSLTQDLQNSLTAALNREDVTPEEIELAKDVLPKTRGS